MRFKRRLWEETESKQKDNMGALPALRVEHGSAYAATCNAWTADVCILHKEFKGAKKGAKTESSTLTSFIELQTHTTSGKPFRELPLDMENPLRSSSGMELVLFPPRPKYGHSTGCCKRVGLFGVGPVVHSSGLTLSFSRLGWCCTHQMGLAFPKEKKM